jgi:hypothetical protein
MAGLCCGNSLASKWYSTCISLSTVFTVSMKPGMPRVRARSIREHARLRRQARVADDEHVAMAQRSDHLRQSNIEQR